MAIPKKAELADGEYFILCDIRSLDAPTFNCELYDCDPQETKTIVTMRAAYYRTLVPGWAPNDIFSNDLFHQRSSPFSMPANLVHKRLCHRKPKPKRGLTDYMLRNFYDFAAKGNNYWVVSPEWRAAIESLEPGLHEFFPYELAFPDGNIQRYIFRDRQHVADATRGMLDPSKYIYHPSEPSAFDLARYPYIASRQALAGRHWIRPMNWWNKFVSRDLAALLLPLLPTKVLLVPLVMAD